MVLERKQYLCVTVGQGIDYFQKILDSSLSVNDIASQNVVKGQKQTCVLSLTAPKIGGRREANG